MRATRAEVDLAAVRHNVATVDEHIGSAELCAVVKADGYGHGAIAVGQAALAAGATWLAVALVEEAAVLRRAGVDAPILLLSEPRLADLEVAVDYELRLAVYTAEVIDALGVIGRRAGMEVPVHLKVNTGMNRVGVRWDEAVALVERADATRGVVVEAVWTHCAVADEPGNPFTEVQLDRFDDLRAELDRRGLLPPLVHAANSAAAIDHPRSRGDLVRAGISVYGLAPSPAMADRLPLRPAMSLRSEVSMVKRVPAGEGLSYGLRYVTPCDTVVATVPVGYADGVPRALSATGAQVRVGDRLSPMVGVVTMDQVLVDCGPEAEVERGDEVVLFGAEPGLGAADWAEAVGTIGYEIVCGIGPRVPRLYRG